MTIYFGGVEMPAPRLNGGLVETYENVWSADTGRNSAGRMMGTLVATKAKLKFSWTELGRCGEDQERDLWRRVYDLHLSRRGRPGPYGERLFRHAQLQPVQLAGRPALGHVHQRGLY